MQETEHLALSKLIIYIIILFSISLSAQNFPDKKVDSLLKAGIEKIILQDYDGAEYLFSFLDKKYDDLPFGKIYLAATEISRTYDYQKPFETDTIEILLNEAIDKAEELIDKNDNIIWNHYYMALAEGYFAYLKALDGNYFVAFSTGLSSVEKFEDCIKIDSSFYESYIALGTYKYWKSRKTEFISWLPFIEDEKDTGIVLLKKAIQENSYNSYLAINSLIWIYIDNEQYYKAVELAESILQKYPENRIFKWGLARAYEDIDIPIAIEKYSEILNSYQKIPNQNRINIIVLKHIIAQQYVKIGEYKKALLLCNEIISINNLSEFEFEEIGDRLERVINLKKELSDKLKS